MKDDAPRAPSHSPPGRIRSRIHIHREGGWVACGRRDRLSQTPGAAPARSRPGTIIAPDAVTALPVRPRR
jgi:hypothetical protein